MMDCCVGSSALGTSKPFRGNSTDEICARLRQNIRAQAKSLKGSAKSLREQAEEKTRLADSLVERLDTVKLLDPPPLTALAMCAEETEESESSHRPLSYPSLEVK